MSARYAEATKVEADRSRAEIEATLRRYRARGFLYAWEGDRVALAFELGGRRFRFSVDLPERSTFRHTAGGKPRTDAATRTAHEQAIRQLWRALALAIKAKLEACAAGIATLEQEFFAHLVLPDGRTVHEATREAVAEAYGSGQVPALLPDFSTKKEMQ